MSERLTELLLRAVRSLPPAEQDEVMAALLTGALAGPPPGGQAPGIQLPGLQPLGIQAVGAQPLAMQPLGMQPLGTLDSLGSQLAPDRLPADPEAALRVLPVRLPVTDYERLRAFSRQHGFSMAVIIRTLVERFLDGQARRWAPPAAERDEDLDDGNPAGHA